MEELEDDPSSEMLAIELYRPAVYAARTFDLLYVLRQASCVCTCTLPFHSPPPLLCLIQVPACTYVPALRAQAVPLVHEHRRTGSPRAGIESGE
jgi:hypothetical protein